MENQPQAKRKINWPHCPVCDTATGHWNTLCGKCADTVIETGDLREAYKRRGKGKEIIQ